MIERPRQLAVLARLLSRNRAAALLGTRQVGKTTPAREFAKRQSRTVR